MGCSSCGSGTNGTPKGCGDKGNCGSGGCNKLNTYDWISTRELSDPSEYNIVEVSFKNGAHKDFFINDHHNHTMTGDMVLVETSSGYDVGKISLSGELVRLQIKKKSTNEDRLTFKVIRKANERDIEKLQEARDLEKDTMIKARIISNRLGLDMKLGDVQFQGDKKKATFYYTAEGRVDFRELVKEYAREFRVKIEMRQIGARQESARIGGIGSCGRELCCSTWLSDFKSVNTSAARYQNIAINQTKLSGQCGRLKCCLNYELDTYMDALDDFPEDADVLKTKMGIANLVKTDIFKGILYYVIDNEKMRGQFIAVDKVRAKAINEMNKKGIIPAELMEEKPIVPINRDVDDPNIEHDYEDVTGLIELKNEPRKKKKPNRKSNQSNSQQNNRNVSSVADNSNAPKKPKQEVNAQNTNKQRTSNNNQGQKPANTNRSTESNKQNNPNTITPNHNSGEAQKQNPNNKKKKYFNKKGKPNNNQPPGQT